MVATIENVIRDIPGWADRHVRVEPIAAGLTNRNYRVEIDGDPFFVRIPGAATELLAVDRGNELQNTRAAAQAGVGPRVLRERGSRGRQAHDREGGEQGDDGA